jgi:hypothetical protein
MPAPQCRAGGTPAVRPEQAGMLAPQGKAGGTPVVRPEQAGMPAPQGKAGGTPAIRLEQAGMPAPQGRVGGTPAVAEVLDIGPCNGFFSVHLTTRSGSCVADAIKVKSALCLELSIRFWFFWIKTVSLRRCSKRENV